MEFLNELLAEIEQIPAVDVLSLVDMTSPTAEGAQHLLSPLDRQAERIDAAVLERMQGTAAYWGLTQITQDLLGIEHLPHLTDPNELVAKLREESSEDGWVESVLGRANVSHVLAACPWHSEIPAASGRFAPVVRLDHLVNEPFTRKVLDKLAEVSDQSVYEVADLNKAVAAFLRKAKSAGAAAVCAAFPPNAEFEPGSRDSADRILSLVLLGQKTDRDDRRSMRSYVIDQVVKTCAETELPFQIIVGTRKTADDRWITGYECGTVNAFAGLFARHSGIVFDVISAHPALASEFTGAARVYPNLRVSAAWPFSATPVHVRRILRERIEMLPMTSSSALASAACCVEWVYAGAQLARRELALTLADMIREGYLTRGAAMDVARHYLRVNPMRVYGLG